MCENFARNSVVLTVALLFCGFSITAQQSSVCTSFSDVRLNKDEPTVYITIERFGKALDPSEQRLANEDLGGRSRKKGEHVWLRIHNNTCWPISLIQYGMYVPKQQAGENLGARFKRIGVLDDGAETGLYYAVFKDRNQIGYSGIDSYNYVKLLSGRTALFSVDRDALKNQQYIRVTFIFDWEFQRGSERKGYTTNEPSHYLEFSNYDLRNREKK
jgi:hypothetical protein